MREIVMKYETLVENGQWDTKFEKYVHIFDLTSHIQELKILFAKESTSQDRKDNINVGNTRFNNGGRSWKTTAPTSGEYWTKENNGWHLALVQMV